MAAAVTLPRYKWRRSPNVSSRRGAPIIHLVLHASQGTYESAVSWLCNPTADASAHGVLREDGGEFTQLVAWREKAWHAAAGNPSSIGIERAGYVDRRPAAGQLRRLARLSAFLCQEFGIPPEWTRNPARPGIMRHADGGPSWGHVNDVCMPLADWHDLMELTAYEYRRGGFRPVYGRY